MPSGVRLPHPFATHGETEQIKTKKILNGAGNSWSQIFIKLSEYVMVHILSKYWTLFFFLIMHGYHGNQLQRFSLQTSKITNWIWQKSLFFLTLYLRKVFISSVFNTNYERDHLDVFNTNCERDHLDQTLLHYHNCIHYYPQIVCDWNTVEKDVK